MTVMVSFRADDEDVAEIDQWAKRLGVDRSELLRDALTSHLAYLSADADADRYEREPFSSDEAALDTIDDWGSAEDWSDWSPGLMRGNVRRGEVWFAAVPGGDRPVLVLTRDPVADRIDRVAVAALTRTRRGLVSEVDLTPEEDDVPTDCVVSLDNLHTLAKSVFRRQVATLTPARMARVCRALRAATAC